MPPAGGAAEEAERHARLAEEAAASMVYGQERLDAAMARALVCRPPVTTSGMADALGYWQDDAALDGRSRASSALWRPLLAEGLVGSGQSGQAAAVLDRLRADSGQAGYLQPALAWLEGWLAEQRGHPKEALRIYQRGEDTASTQSPVHTARLLLAHGRLPGGPGTARTRSSACAGPALVPGAARRAVHRPDRRGAGGVSSSHRPCQKQSVLALTSRETQVAHLVGKGLSNPEIAAELFISRKAVEYHLGNIYAKCELQGRHQLRRFVEQWRQPAAV